MYEDKAKGIERKLLKGLNDEQSWVERHPAWTTVLGLILFVALLVSMVKSCHT